MTLTINIAKYLNSFVLMCTQTSMSRHSFNNSHYYNNTLNVSLEEKNSLFSFFNYNNLILMVVNCNGKKS